MKHYVVAAAGLFLIAGCGSDTGTAQDKAASGEPATTEIVLNCPTAGADGVIHIRPGLEARVLKNGYGRSAMMGDLAGVHAVLWIHDASKPDNKGELIWSSGGTEPFEFQVGQSGFIEGWSPGIECMLLGETRELVIAPELAYGERGRAPVPPGATLLYELELVRLSGPADAGN